MTDTLEVIAMVLAFGVLLGAHHHRAAPSRSAPAVVYVEPMPRFEFRAPRVTLSESHTD